jgi:hypothetical protein
VLFLLAMPGARVLTQAPADESKVKAAFVYNFLKFVEWPATAFRAPRDSFVVGIIGDGPTAEATEQFLAAKLIGAHPLVTRRMKWDHSFLGVHAVFVSEPDSRRLRRVLDSARTTLTIGEGAEFATRGGVIGLLVENDKVRFDVNTDAAEVAGLRISSKLLALTRIIVPAPGTARP